MRYGRLTDKIIRVAVDMHVCGIGQGTQPATGCILPQQIIANTARLRARSSRIQRHHHRKPVTPAFSHLLGIRQTIGRCRATRQPYADSVCIFMGNDPVVESAVIQPATRIPQMQLHAGPLPVRRGGERSPVDTAHVLRIDQHIVAAQPTATEIICLKIAIALIETIVISDIMQVVGPVKSIGHARVPVDCRIARLHSIIEHERSTGYRRISKGCIVTIVVKLNIGVVANGRCQPGSRSCRWCVPAQRRCEWIGLSYHY